MNSLRNFIPAVIAVALCLPAWPQSAPTAQQTQEPTWPQAFDAQGPQVHTYGFAVTQPGPIVVSVQAQGAPLSLSVQGPRAPLEAVEVSTICSISPLKVQKGCQMV